ncbi:MAG: hypothetical protein HY784_07220 [Chloroflexi bacterium]|nr:hypothetical protein [Chloroflexota bacterium]
MRDAFHVFTFHASPTVPDSDLTARLKVKGLKSAPDLIALLREQPALAGLVRARGHGGI